MEKIYVVRRHLTRTTTFLSLKEEECIIATYIDREHADLHANRARKRTKRILIDQQYSTDHKTETQFYNKYDPQLPQNISYNCLVDYSVEQVILYHDILEFQLTK